MTGIYARIPKFLKLEMDDIREKLGIKQEKQVEIGIELFVERYKMKNLIKDESAIMNPIIDTILSLAIIVIMYWMFMPLLWFISNTMISIGAPAATTLFFMKCAMWGFFLFALGAIIVLIAKVYKKTHDTEMYNQFGGI